MSRVPRIQVENAVYYVTPAGNYGEAIFKDEKDYALYMELLAQYKNKHNFKLFAFCLAPKSINLLIEPSASATISQIMHDLNPNYTKHFNKKYNRKGRLFQERYQIVLIEKEPNLPKMTAYIHLRPKFLHLTDDINKYKHTSFLKYLTEERKKPGVEAPDGAKGDKLNMLDEVAYVLGRLNGKSYRQFVDEVGSGEVKELDKALKKEQVIGSAEFRQEVESKIKGESQAPEALPQAYTPIEKPEPLPQPVPIQVPETAGRPAFNIWILAAAACLVILSFIFSISFARTNILRIKESVKQEIAGKEIELQKKLANELDAASKDLSKTYEAKFSSYKAMVERLEAEKRKAEDELSKARVSLRLRSGAIRRRSNP